jgi:hypothetical protein
MTDLRTRIAVAACGATSAGKLFPWDTLSEPQRDAWRAIADAVIRDVLTPEFLADLVITAVQKAADDE